MHQKRHPGTTLPFPEFCHPHGFFQAGGEGTEARTEEGSLSRVETSAPHRKLTLKDTLCLSEDSGAKQATAAGTLVGRGPWGCPRPGPPFGSRQRAAVNAGAPTSA